MTWLIISKYKAMTKTRVKDGHDFFYISHGLDVHIGVECDWGDFVDDCFEAGNYFHTRKEAEAMAEKIRKVLKGIEE